jgi:hypothetical protein
MLCQCLIADSNEKTGTNDLLLIDILPNIGEIRIRINNLISTIVNHQLLSNLKCTLKFAPFAISPFIEFENTSQMNQQAIISEIEQIQKNILT